MTFLPRFRTKRTGLKTSLRFEVIDERFKRYPDGREVCLDTKKGEAEYKRRTMEMYDRQDGMCGRGYHGIIVATFDHLDGRGMGSARRDDRTVDENGHPMNCCSCWICNGIAGSNRSSRADRR